MSVHQFPPRRPAAPDGTLLELQRAHGAVVSRRARVLIGSLLDCVDEYDHLARMAPSELHRRALERRASDLRAAVRDLHTLVESIHRHPPDQGPEAA